MLVKEFIANFLAHSKNTNCFGVSGANIEELYSELKYQGIENLVLAKSEYSASTMAVGSYLATKQVAAVLTTSGPGILNTLPVLAEAFTSKIPLVLIGGLIPNELEGLGSFQDGSGKGPSINIQEIVKSVTKYSLVIKRADEVPNVLKKAFEDALQSKMPIAILIPKNIFSETLELQVNEEVTIHKKINSNKISEIIDILKNSKIKPLVILGEHLVHENNLNQINNFLNMFDVKVALTPNAKAFFNHHDSRFIGVTGIMGHDEVVDYLIETETIVFIGTSFDMISRYDFTLNEKTKNLIIINEFKTDISNYLKFENSIEVVTKLSDFFSSLKEVSPVEIANKEFPKNKDYSFQSIVEQFSFFLSKEDNVFVDAGNAGAFFIHNLILSGENLFHCSLGMGGMGNSIGMSIGATIGNKKRSYAFLGDGSFLMHGLEVHTAVELEIPVTFVIMNNNSHGMCTTREEVFLNGETGINNFKKSCFGIGLGEMFPGLSTFEISNQDELNDLFIKLPKVNGPCVVSINILNNVSPPFRSFYKKQ